MSFDSERLCRTILTSPIELLGYKVSFMGEAHLRWLFGEIFMDAPYFFRTDNDRPLIFDCGSNIGMSVLFFAFTRTRASRRSSRTPPRSQHCDRTLRQTSSRMSNCIPLRSAIIRPDRTLSRPVAGKFKPENDYVAAASRRARCCRAVATSVGFHSIGYRPSQARCRSRRRCRWASWPTAESCNATASGISSSHRCISRQTFIDASPDRG